MPRRFRYAPLVLVSGALLLGGCATLPPSGPSILVLPGTGKNFDQFRVDDADCRHYASSQIGGATPGRASDDGATRSAAADKATSVAADKATSAAADTATSAAAGTAIGAVAGAAIGGGSGAAAGAGAGLIVGSVAGTGASAGSARSLQQRYDFGFQQCMYARGHRVPTYGRFVESRPAPPSAPQYTQPPPQNAAPPVQR